MAWHGDASNIAVPLRDQIIDRLIRRVFLLKENRAIAGLTDITVDDQQGHRNAVHQRHNRLFTHIAGIENNGVALPVGQHLHGFLLTLRRVVTIGDDQLLAVRLRLARGLLQQAAKVESIKCGNHQANAVAGAIRQRAR